MSTKESSNIIQITSPCDADWDSMIGTDRVRFCEHCQLSVRDISEMNRKQIRKLVARSNGRLCVRDAEPNYSTPVLLLHKIGRRTSRIAAGAFSASLTLTSALAGSLNPDPFPESTPAVTTTSSLKNGGGTLTGVVFDPNGAVIPSAQVTLTNVETKEVFSAYSDGNGTYNFENLPAGTFNLKIAADGFADSDVPLLKFRANDTNRIDQTLSIQAVRAEVEITAPTSERFVVMGGGVRALPKDPLVKAAQEDNIEAVRLALLEKPNANVRDSVTQATALEYAVRNSNREMIQLLLWAKADVNLKDGSGQTVLMMLEEDATSEIVWDLLHAGAKVNMRDSDGETALMSAAQINNVDVIKTLLDAGAKVNGSNNDGMTALMFVAQEGHVNNARALLLAGAEVNVRDKDGKSALAYAEENNQRAVARLLKTFGAIAYARKEEDKDK